jgi:glycosyltransferase involved in cell wall biosynthesis
VTAEAPLVRGCLYVASPTATLTGGPICALEHAAALNPHFDDCVLVLCAPGPLEEIARRRGVRTWCSPFVYRGLRRGGLAKFVRNVGAVVSSRWRYVRGLRDLMRDKPGLLHVHCRAAHLPYALLAGRWARVPTVVSLHEPWAGGFEAWTELWMVRLLADHVVFPARNMALGHPAMMRRNSSVMHYYMQPRAPRAAPAPGKVPLVVMPALMDRRKGFDVFLEVCRRVGAERTDCEFWMVGGWRSEAERGEAQAFLARNGLEGRVKDCGVLADMDGVYAQADVVLLTSRRDPLPRVVMEAMCHGLPVVATRVDGIPEMVEDGATGFLAESEDAQGLAEAVGRLLEDAALRRRMGEAGRERAGRLFSPEAYARASMDVYSRLLPTTDSKSRI